ncbi:MAG: 1-acyl-sn-glycerol-3-phosphate acyltransferase [Acetatifactor sp.]|nr:1-acyl-sn-glycerol-3-phosphate acyltransferase [Acetatifactor sp.]
MINKGTCWLFHSLLINVLKNQRKQLNQELHILNTHSTYTRRNVIYAVNHSCKYDFPIASEVIGVHTCVLVAKQRLRIVDYVGFLLNGVVWVNRDSRESKRQAFQEMLLCMKKGLNMCIFPESTWNITPSKPMLPMYWGIIDLAKQSGCPIIPLVLEFRGNDCYAMFGEPIYCSSEDGKQEKFEELEEAMATLKWDIWEAFPIVSRNTIRPDEWDKVVEERTADYPLGNFEDEKRYIRKV